MQKMIGYRVLHAWRAGLWEPLRLASVVEDTLSGLPTKHQYR